MKSKIIFIGLFMWLIYFILYPQEAYSASCDGILLWFYQILPTLLPYAILSNIILSSNILFSAGVSHRKLFGSISSVECFAILCGMLFGFPIGSKLSADLLEKKLISTERAQILCAFTNNMSPAFVITFVLTQTLQRTDLILPTCLILYGIPLTYGLIRLLHTDTISTQKPASGFHVNMQIIDAGITSSFETLIRLCGYIVMFSILTHIVMQFPLLGTAGSICLTGILEITNGIAALGSSELPQYLQYPLAIFFLCFGGISGIAQTGSMILRTGLSLYSYIKTRLLLAILTATAACIYVIGCFALFEQF